ncbi:acyltransferase family protein, partial [Pseudoclavibacter helvolus]|uniref:acyltransferase family protein n=1 Tax=Pseudoclavibacter helvolus TaxID=255205 RepID=UPI003B8A6337
MTTKGSSNAGARTQRLDIQVLRAVAVGAVLLYHLWPNRFTGGYVGVDIFFVISGFL